MALKFHTHDENRGIVPHQDEPQTRFEPFKKCSGSAAILKYSKNDRVYIHPGGYIYLSNEVWRGLSSPDYVIIGTWPETNHFAIIPYPNGTDESYTVYKGETPGSPVRISCKRYLRKHEMLVADNIISYPMMLLHNHPEFVCQSLHWYTKQKPPPIRATL